MTLLALHSRPNPIVAVPRAYRAGPAGRALGFRVQSLSSPITRANHFFNVFIETREGSPKRLKFLLQSICTQPEMRHLNGRRGDLHVEFRERSHTFKPSSGNCQGISRGVAQESYTTFWSLMEYGRNLKEEEDIEPVGILRNRRTSYGIS